MKHIIWNILCELFYTKRIIWNTLYETHYMNHFIWNILYVTQWIIAVAIALVIVGWFGMVILSLGYSTVFSRRSRGKEHIITDSYPRPTTVTKKPTWFRPRLDLEDVDSRTYHILIRPFHQLIPFRMIHRTRLYIL